VIKNKIIAKRIESLILDTDLYTFCDYRMKFIIILILLLSNFNCSERVVKLEVQGSSYCSKMKFKLNYQYPDDSKIIEILNHPSLTDFSRKSIEFSIAYNFHEELIKLKSLEKNELNKATPSVQFLLQKEKVLQNIYFAQADIYAMESELRCYDDRFSEIINDLKDTESEIIQRNSFSAILVGGIGTILDGASADYASFNRVVVLTSGALITYFSYLAFDPNVVVEFKPKSTILKDLWHYPKTSTSFSDPIWFLLTRDYITLEPKNIQRNILVKRWEENGYIGRDQINRDRLIELYFGKGGLSNIKETTNRKEMITETLVILDLYQQLIRTFQYEVLFGKVSK